MSLWIAGAVVVGSTLYGAHKGGQQEEAYDEAEAAALEIQKQKAGLLGEQKGLAGETANLGMAAAQSQFAGGQRDVTMGTQMGMRGIQAGAATAASRSGLATSGTIEQQTKIQTGDLMAKYKSDMTKLFETKELAGKKRDIGMAQADLSYRQGETSAEESFQNTMAGFDEGGMGAGALEGFMSGIGTGATIAASDRRLKANIDYIGDSPSGIKIYEFNYLNNDVRHRGVIANELVDSYPNAISEDKDGYYMVDYSQIDVNFEIVKGD